MTTPDLNHLAKLRADRAKLHDRRAELRSTRGRLPSTAMDGMPKARGGVSRRTEKVAALIADLDAAIQRKELEIIRAECELQQYISTVPDSRLRLILRYRCIDGLPWAKVAQAMGRFETPAGVKATFLRFVRQQCQNPT